MAVDNLETVLAEEQFPGNTDAFNQLCTITKDHKLLMFVGAGASAPTFPTWKTLLVELLRQASNEGLLTSDDESYITYMITNDPLEAAELLQGAFGREVFRDRVASRFRTRDDITTKAQDLLVTIQSSGIVTLNYDEGIKLAAAKATSKKVTSIQLENQYEILHWQKYQNTTDLYIIHLHGTCKDPSRIVFTSSDYHTFYDIEFNQTFIRQLWQSNYMLAIGFGFTDPFFIRAAEKALRTLPIGNQHFAFIGYNEGSRISPIGRRSFSSKYRLKPIFYNVGMHDDGSEDHSRLLVLLDGIKLTHRDTFISNTSKQAVGTSTERLPSTDESNAGSSAHIHDTFEEDLFVAPVSNKKLYVNPRLLNITTTRLEERSVDEENDRDERVEIAEIVHGLDSFIITSPPEFGMTTLCRRLLVELKTHGYNALLYDADALPNYKKKLVDCLDPYRSSSGGLILILDRFDVSIHERLLKEIIGTGIVDRFIICTQATNGGGAIDFFTSKKTFSWKVLRLKQLDRADIRTLASSLFYTSDDDFVSDLVDRAYNDLLNLFVPLTPSNVIMYLVILHKEGDYKPLSRIDIIAHYIYQLLSKPSDIYKESFSARNKIDVLSRFCYWLYRSEKTEFFEDDWKTFCKSYKSDRLLYFDEHELLRDLMHKRILIRKARSLCFKYRIFYSYFLGLYVARDRDTLLAFVENDSYMCIEELVEVIAATSPDNTALLEHLVCRFNKAFDSFSHEFLGHMTDPFVDIRWDIHEKEEQILWEPLSKCISAGPLSPDIIDQLKRRPLSEERAERQDVIINKFDDAERNLLRYLYSLVAVVNNSDCVSGSLKRSAIQCICRGFAIIYKAGLAYAPVIAAHETYIWNGVVFYNQRADQMLNEPDEKKVLQVVLRMCGAVAETAVSQIGSRKLGEAYKSLAIERTVYDFEWLLLYACVIRTKSPQWHDIANEMIQNVNRYSFYLREVLDRTFRQFREEVNTGIDRESLKRLIASIRAKRELGKQNPSHKLVRRVLGRLEKSNSFED